MNKLDEARLIINEVDEKIAELFEKRFKAVKIISEYKIANNLPTYDKKREDAVIERGLSLIKDDDLKPYFEKFLHSMMDISKEYQEVLKKK